MESLGYNEGWYSGWMRNGLPEGKGKLVYDDFVDGSYYSIIVDGFPYRALSYEGTFKNGWRDGNGTVYYEGDYRDEGVFYGK